MRTNKLFSSIFLAMLSSAYLQASVIPGRWEKVDALPPGSEIIVAFKAGDTIQVQGELIGLSQDFIRIALGAREEEFPKSAVSKVSWLKKGWPRKKKTVWSALIGFSVGFSLGLAAAPTIADNDNMPNGERVGAAAGLGGIIGGIAAGLAASGGPSKTREVVIFEAKP